MAATVVVDRTHRYFFDQDCDYVLSTLLLEASLVAASPTASETR
jgi:hypothetical protein